MEILPVTNQFNVGFNNEKGELLSIVCGGSGSFLAG